MEDLVSAPFSGFFAGKQVLVTGHTGFKGSWLCAWLRRLGARVVGLALPAEEPSLYRLAAIERDLVASLNVDVRDAASVRAAVHDHRPDVVFHLAAQSLVRRSYRAPVETLAVNVMGTAHVLEACRDLDGVRAIVVVTSDKCYDDRGRPRRHQELDPMGGADPYSASKGCAELITAAYRRSFFADRPVVASARAGNVIGGGDFAEDRLVPDIVRSIAAGRPVAIRNPRATRPWQHVLDPLGGYLLLAERLAEAPAGHAEAWNFGPQTSDESSAVPVAELARRLIVRLGKGSMEIASDAGAPHEAPDLALDCTKAERRLGWTPRFDLQQSIDRTAAWYAAWLADPSSARAVLDAQIAEYEGLVRAR